MLFLNQGGLVSLKALVFDFFFCDELDGELGGLIDDQFISRLLPCAGSLPFHDLIEHD